MAYSNLGLRLLIPAIGAGPAVWYYSNTDAHTTVDNDDYFTDGISFGMKLNDVVIVVDTDSATCTIHSVRTPTTAGVTASINTATLA